jgi:hypothetical protein
MEIASPRVGFARWDMGGMPPHRCVHFIFQVERAFTASSGRGVRGVDPVCRMEEHVAVGIRAATTRPTVADETERCG